jgi:isocitrate dehydrogenase
MASTPEVFDVLVMENLYGDILSDVAAQITGSVGLAGSANIGENFAMFEAIHGSAPRRANQNLANPSGLLLGSVMMLNHIGQNEIATRVHNAWLKTLEDGIHTYDIFKEKISKEKVGTKEFSRAVVDRLGEKPLTLRAADYKRIIKREAKKKDVKKIKKATKDLVGIDVFLDWSNGTADDLGELLKKITSDGLKLTSISNRGEKVWPEGHPETFCTDHWRCRYVATNKGEILNRSQLIQLLDKINDAGFDFIKTEHLYNFDRIPGYSHAHT